MGKIIILDFGSQTTQLISRRVRDLGVYSEIFSGDINITENNIITDDVVGIILSGSPSAVYDENAPKPDFNIFKKNLPILGICYGFQVVVQQFGGKVAKLGKKEYGRSKIKYGDNSALFDNIPENWISWMSHGDSIEKLPEDFVILAESEHHIASAYCKDKKFWGIQFHPEVTHSEYGKDILQNFLFKICVAKKSWSIDKYAEEIKQNIRAKVGDKSVLLLISGGVDSAVVGGLLLKSLPASQIYLMYINTGMMRKNESQEVEKILKNLGAKNLYMVDAEKEFLSALENITAPEEKRKIIGDTFIKVQEKEIAKLNIGGYFLAQGTLYTDLIESGKGVGNKAQVIKSHHNVRTPLIEKKREMGLVIEPLDKLYKDEVRALGKLIGFSDDVVYRHPFPGPGLGVRILGEITKQKCDILREADYIFINELKRRNLYREIWQAFAILLPIRSVGVAGDSRMYGYVLSLRAIVSLDGMSADVYNFQTKDLLEISSLITNSVPEIGRVVYDITSKPPATIEWE